MQPQQCWGHIIKGESFHGLTKREAPFRTQVIIYRKNIPEVGGLGTFIEQFVEQMGDFYDIVVCCDTIHRSKYQKYIKKIRVLTNAILSRGSRCDIFKNIEPIYCDSLIMLSAFDPIPTNIHTEKVVRMCHTCKTDPSWKVLQDFDELIWVSKTAMNSFGVSEGTVIHNMCKEPTQKALILVSATRFPAPDKGIIEWRMRKLANMLNDKGLPFIWLNYSDGWLPDPPKNFYNMGVSEDMQSIIMAADYLVQLSDSECWSYSCLEALMAGTALICTPFPSTSEMGIKDGVNAHIVPFDMDFDVTQLLKVPSFGFAYDNNAIREEWREILGNKPPRHDYRPDELVEVLIKQEFLDVELNEYTKPGQRRMVTKERAAEMMANLGKKYVEIIGG